MGDTRWKAVERRIMRQLGGRRLAVDGRRGSADGIVPAEGHAIFAVQVKSRRRATRRELDAWVRAIQAEAEEKWDGATGVLVVHEPGRPAKDGLVVLRFSDWVQLHGK